jgi:hypothetical protein
MRMTTAGIDCVVGGDSLHFHVADFVSPFDASEFVKLPEDERLLLARNAHHRGQYDALPLWCTRCGEFIPTGATVLVDRTSQEAAR